MTETVKPKTKARFTDFQLDDRLIQAINELGWEHPTRVQEGMIPLGLQGKSIVARARTGSGKTAAFLLPLLQRLLQWTSSDDAEGPFALVIAPTKELATQIFKSLTQLAARFAFLQLVNLAEKEAANMDRALATSVDLIVSTPGRIIEALNQKSDLLKGIKFVVLDEADLLFSFGYKEDLVTLKKHLPKKFQSIMTSATLEEEMTELKRMFASGTVVLLKLKEGQLPSAEQLVQYQVYCQNDEERFAIVLALLKLKLLVGKTIFFVSSIDRCYKLHLFFQGFKIRSCILNSQMPANTRSHVIQEFNDGKFKYIIASDSRDSLGPLNEEETAEPSQSKKKKKQRIAHDKESGVSRGIDFHFVSNVVNFDFPSTTELYIHRVGRTARGFNRGTALSLISPHERPAFERVREEINAQFGENTIAPYEVRMSDFDAFFIRTREVLSALNKTKIREARLAEIKRELLSSKRLDAYFSKNPREKAALENDKRLFELRLHSTAISDVADYMVPKALRGRDYKSGDDLASSLGNNRKRRFNNRRPIFGKSRNKTAKRGNTKDPLRSFTMVTLGDGNVKLEGKARYETVKHLGEGQFANVYMAKDLVSGDIVAIKKIKLGSRAETQDGLNRTALREIKLLQELQHDNIITLRDVFGRRTNIQLVFDYMETDLENLIRERSIILSQSHVKNICLQMLLGLEFLHLHWILHRDLKPNNLLLNSAGRIKITDFGLARYFGSPNRLYTNQVVTRWYRPPELLYGARSYGVGVDVWSVGCIIAELLLRAPFFPGETDLDQLCKIYHVTGTPTAEEWPEIQDLPHYVQIRDCPRIEFETIFTAASPALIHLIGSCLRLNPNNRCTTTEALSSLYFQEEPYPCDANFVFPKESF